MRFLFVLIGGLSTGAMFLSLLANIVLALLLSMTYTSLTREDLVAKLRFSPIANTEKVHRAYLFAPDDTVIGNYVLNGDQWRIDAYFIKMKYMANIFGMDSKYALDRIVGRYKNIREANTHQHIAYQIESHDIIDTFSFFVDTRYGSSTFKEIKPQVEYLVYKTPTGIMVREKSIPIQHKKSFLENLKFW